MADLFISYSRKDIEFVRTLHAALQQQGLDSWVDWEGIPPSTLWLQEIFAAIDSADIFLLIISPDSVMSRVARQEIDHALAHNKRIIPLVYRPVEHRLLHPDIAQLNTLVLDGADFEQQLDKLVAVINTDYDFVRTHTRLLTRGLEWESKRRDSSLLLRGSALREAEAWLERAEAPKQPQPTALHHQYIYASQREEDDGQMLPVPLPEPHSRAPLKHHSIPPPALVAHVRDSVPTTLALDRATVPRLLLLALFVAIVASSLMSLAASAFVPLALSQVAVIWTILLGSIMGCSGVVFLLNLPQARTRRSVAPEIGTQVLTRRELRQYREVMLDKMQATWIKGVLEQSLHGTPLIALELQEQTDAVVRPWNHVLQEFDPPPRVLPHGTRISEVFEAAGGKLLILGEAGSGKTTLLLDLARDLLEQARSDDARPLPVVFNLAAWATRRQPLAAWLVEELHDPNKYNVPRAVAQHWIATHQLLPLLDGLDEVAAPHRTACVEALNAYQAEHDVVPLVVCSRTADYPGRTARVRLHLSTAVVLQPLTPEQIRAYLAGAGMDVTALRAVLGEDPLLLDLASTPLMLSFMIQAYPDLDTLPRSGATTIPERQRELFGAYVEHMLYRRRRPVVPRYTPQETVRWLSWLAQGMLRHNQSVFYLEHLQPTWLATSQQRWAYIVSGVSSIGLVYTIAGLLLGILASGLIVILGLDELADAVLFAGVVLGLAFGMVTGLGFGLGEALQRADEIHIRPVETMRWSRPPAGKMWSWAVLGGLLGAAAGALFGAMTVYKVTGWAAVLAGAWAGMPAGALAGGLFAGVRMRAVETRARPNQGIWRSARSALRGGLVFALVFGLCGGGLFGLAYGLTTGMYNEPADMRSVLADCTATSAAVALLIGTLSCGGDVCLWHLVLRLVLWRRHCMPLNYVRFLNEAADRSLLRKVEGGYIFAHRLLLEYLATHDSAQDAHAAPESVR